VRGSRNRLGDGRGESGSIPARAGEPSARHVRRDDPRVYPRACGGARNSHECVPDLGGLSPRVRGSPAGPVHPGAPRGSIPARAGEPRACGVLDAPAGVYPRACGGARGWCRIPCGQRGLSPRVRGSLLHTNARKVVRGSIPARAGEPAIGGLPEPEIRVYPRACGGASERGGPRSGRVGLSPRVRGSHAPPVSWTPLPGSIPARAGEPLPAS